MIKDIISKNEDIKPNEDKINKLKQIIPNCFDKNGKLDIELLKKEFNQDIDLTRESYELNFLGKSYAKMITGLDTETVIDPDIEHNNKSENKNSENIYISGDNLDGLKHLLKAYEGKVKCIYIDPPYNTGSDGFVYNDNFCFTKENLIEKLDISEDEAERIINMTSGHSSSHSAWLTFMYPRLYLAKQLLTDDGVIFISIDDNEQSELKLLCNDVFGEENFGMQIAWRRTDNQPNIGNMARVKEYILYYSKNKDIVTFGKLPLSEKARNEYRYKDNKGFFRRGILLDKTRGRYNYPIKTKSGKILNGPWMKSEEEFYRLEKEGLIYWTNGGEEQPYTKIYLNDNNGQIANDFWGIEFGTNQRGSLEVEKLFNNRCFDFPKPVSLIYNLIKLGSDKDSIVLDFFSGSATTAHAVMQLNAEDGGNRNYIMVQLQEQCDKKSEAYKNGYKTIDEIGQERIKRAAKKIKEETNADIDSGFKHYTLKETDENLLNKLEQFEPQLINETYDLYKEYGIDTIVETWKLRDGYEFTTPVEVINCDGYNAYKCEESLYLIEPNININNIKSLLEHYNNDELFVCNKLVLFGYSFKFNEFEMIKNNIKQVKNFKNIDVKVYTRY